MIVAIYSVLPWVAPQRVDPQRVDGNSCTGAAPAVWHVSHSRSTIRPRRAVIRIPNTFFSPTCIGSALHHVDVFHLDGAAVAEEDDKDGKADGSLSRRHGQDEHGEDLPHQIARERGEGDKIDVDRQKHQFDRHQDDDHVLAVQEDPENPDDEEGRSHRQVMFKSDHRLVPHGRLWPGIQ